MLELLLTAVLIACPASAHADDEWKPAPGPLKTRWSADVRPDNPWNVYPRPQFKRDAWRSLNGLWEYEIRPAAGTDSAATAKPIAGKILVPYPIESQLSGVGRELDPSERLIYRRNFDITPPTDGSRVLLHFGAVDWACAVSVNDTDIGTHEGAFDPFTFDITRALKAGANRVQVIVTDASDAAAQPRGKQVRKPEGIFYTRVSGIWQTVWLETVPAQSIAGLNVVTNRKDGTIAIQPSFASTDLAGATVRYVVADGTGAEVGTASASAASSGTASQITVKDAKPWSPETPALYTMTATLTGAGGATLDTVKTYCAFRDVSIASGPSGQPTIMLNGAPYFMIGLLDQGWWPDGLYTAPTYDALIYDLQVTRQCGFNTVRKHVKVEPAVWYAACDHLGLIVWQDMPSGDKSIGPQDSDIVRTRASATTYEQELRAMINWLRVFPSIVLWVPFNEGWGQFDSRRITSLVRQLDPTRLVTTASGWTDRQTGDILDMHDYAPRLAGHMPAATHNRAWVIGECGGFGLPEPGHLWKSSGWGYTTYKDRDALTAAYEQLAADLLDLRTDGLSAAIYTQTTDVETEVNGVMTYDRDVIKFNSARVQAANRALVAPGGAKSSVQVVVPNARDAVRKVEGAPEWRMTTTEPKPEWIGRHFDPVGWTLARGGFGTKGTPGTNGLIGTEWKSPGIWLRRTIELSAKDPVPTHITIHHDEGAEVWIDAKQVCTLTGYTTGYIRVPIPEEIRALLTPGNHTLAVHCAQTSGGQFIDVGLCAVTKQP